MSAWNPTALDTDEKRVVQRNRIRDLLVKTYKYEYKEDPELLEYNDAHYGKLWKLRYYKMTKSEFEEAKNFCFYLVFDTARDNVHYVEVFCYDVRNLMHESLFRLDLKSGFVPIPLSAARWVKMIELDGRIEELTPYKGILMYPLTKDETQNVFKNIKYRPMICTDENKCRVTSIEQIEKNRFVFEHLHDETAASRFGPQVLLPPSHPRMTSEEVDAVRTTPFKTPFVKTPSRPGPDPDFVRFVVDRAQERLKELDVQDLEIPDLKMTVSAFIESRGPDLVRAQLDKTNLALDKDILVGHLVDAALAQLLLPK